MSASFDSCSPIEFILDKLTPSITLLALNIELKALIMVKNASGEKQIKYLSVLIVE